MFKKVMEYSKSEWSGNSYLKLTTVDGQHAYVPAISKDLNESVPHFYEKYDGMKAIPCKDRYHIDQFVVVDKIVNFKWVKKVGRY